MGAGHAHALYREGTSPLHRLRPQCKVAATFLFTLAVVATPREALWAYGVYALLLAGLAAIARLPPGFVAKRMLFEAPFVLFAVFLPLVGQGQRVEVVGVGLSVDGLWAAWNILAKGTLGLTASILLGATTPVPDLLHGLQRLHLPAALTTIASLMVRYADVIAGELHRMHVARVSRGYDPGWLWQGRALAAAAGTLFIRSYERGERVYLAMVSRGWTGAMPVTDERAAPRGHWAAALALPAVAAVVAAGAWRLGP